MRKLRTAAVLMAVLGNVGLLGASVAHADQGWDRGDSLKVSQHSTCQSHDLNLDVLGQVGIGNGLGGNLLGGEGNPGGQKTSLGSTAGCSNTFGG
ncbi:hypothetical protein OG410_18335 [Streptomyces sp. NBC_00659]|uniref:hypothetical protein n=1 Tax=Streptomyces sp. NBC_00659 TaxID=2903669 RepID=UPI002E34B8EA|nr:hypothetical protein [Streptomyces sp. NBC_00659]